MMRRRRVRVTKRSMTRRWFRLIQLPPVLPRRRFFRRILFSRVGIRSASSDEFSASGK
jgi:hypothetical protein